MLTRGHQKMVIFWHGRYRPTPEVRGVVCPIILWSVFSQEADAKALAEKIAAKKAREEAAARGEVVTQQKGSGGAVKKKDGTKK
jgi:hypothetical protein